VIWGPVSACCRLVATSGSFTRALSAATPPKGPHIIVISHQGAMNAQVGCVVALSREAVFGAWVGGVHWGEDAGWLCTGRRLTVSVRDSGWLQSSLQGTKVDIYYILYIIIDTYYILSSGGFIGLGYISFTRICVITYYFKVGGGTWGTTLYTVRGVVLGPHRMWRLACKRLCTPRIGGSNFRWSWSMAPSPPATKPLRGLIRGSGIGFR
jgi:hypothetical protein